MKDIKRVAITGGAGLIGSAVGRLLQRRGVEAVSLDLTTGGPDVADPGIADALDAAAPDAVVHAAAHPGGKSLVEPVDDVRINALGSMRVFDWCARVKRPVVYLSSSVVYGDQPAGLIPESAVVKPGTVYGVAKVACEQWLRILEAGHGLPWTVLRLFATYGAGHKPSVHQGIVNVMLTQMMTGDRVVVRGSLDRRRDLLYVEDAAAAIVGALGAPASRGQVLNIGTGTAVTIRELIAAIGGVLDRDMSTVEVVEEAGTVGDPFSNVADVSRAHAILGFDATYTLQRGLESLVRDREQARAAAASTGEASL